MASSGIADRGCLEKGPNFVGPSLQAAHVGVQARFQRSLVIGNAAPCHALLEVVGRAGYRPSPQWISARSAFARATMAG